MIKETKTFDRGQTNLSKSTFSGDPVKLEVVEVDLTSKVDGLRGSATHGRGGSDVVREGRAGRCL